MKTILIFSSSGELLSQYTYKTKAVAKKEFKHKKKHGAIDPQTGLIIPNAKIELI